MVFGIVRTAVVAATAVVGGAVLLETMPSGLLRSRTVVPGSLLAEAVARGASPGSDIINYRDTHEGEVTFDVYRSHKASLNGKPTPAQAVSQLVAGVFTSPVMQLELNLLGATGVTPAAYITGTSQAGAKVATDMQRRDHPADFPAAAARHGVVHGTKVQFAEAVSKLRLRPGTFIGDFMVERTRVTPTSAEVLFRSASTGGGSAGVYTWIRAELPGGPISDSADEHPLPANKLRVQYGSCVQFQEPLPGGVIGRGVWSGLCLFHVIYAKIVFGVGTRQAVVMEQVADNVS